MANTNNLVEVTKDGDVIEISPLCLEDHKRLGWSEVVSGNVVADVIEKVEKAVKNVTGGKSKTAGKKTVTPPAPAADEGSG